MNDFRNENGIMLFPEPNQADFDFDSLIGCTSASTICGLRVSIDRIIRDITDTTVVAVSGTMVVCGVKIRGVWDTYGNILECKKSLSLLVPKSFTCSIDSLFANTTSDMFRLVHVYGLQK